MRARGNHTQRALVDALRKAGGLSRIQPLAESLAVSEQTVRRNIKRLADEGLVEIMHGGARLLDPDPEDPADEPEGNLAQRLNENPDAKKRIARRVASMIGHGTSLFLDIGSTTAYIADALRHHRRLLVVTNSVHVAWRLSMRNDNRVFMAGGELRGHDGGVFGAGAMSFADNFSTDHAVLSAAGIDATNGVTLFDLEEAHFTRRIMARAAVRIVAADASKFGREAPVAVGDPSRVDHLVTDRSPPEAIRKAAKRWGTSIHVAE